MSDLKQNTQGLSGNKVNLVTSIVLVGGTLCFMWTAFFIFARTARHKNLDYYRERQETLIFFVYDTFNAVTDEFGPETLELLEMQLDNWAGQIKPERILKKIKSSRHGNLIGYGNALLLFNGHPVYVNGQLADRFRTRNGYFEPTDPVLRIYLDRIHR